MGIAMGAWTPRAARTGALQLPRVLELVLVLVLLLVPPARGEQAHLAMAVQSVSRPTVCFFMESQ